jgi:two-component system response regulator RegX3
VQGAGETLRIFGQAFEGLARRQRLLQAPIQPGVRVDVESGQVFVDGRVVPILTDLEYRLMLLLYGQIDKICDKYRVVEAVWGEDYIDEVDDARIEKLVSRLRQKIEPDVTNPRYMQTIRGRGYKLVEG